jgi:hypothetical protein
MKMEPIEGSETSAIRTKTPGNCPKENILHIEHGESLKSRIISLFNSNTTWTFSTDFRKIFEYQNWRNHSCGTRVVPCGHTDERADMRKLTVSSRDFAKWLKNCVTCCLIKSLIRTWMSNVRCEVTWWKRRRRLFFRLISSCLYCITRLTVIQLFEDKLI